ncbi:MAG: class I adenylate-forming enzyme family protein [Chthonomonadales bacterium]
MGSRRDNWIIEPFARYADRLFLVDALQGRALTYGQAGTAAAGIARMLEARGVAPGDRVGLLLENSLEFALFYFGCLLCGATATPVNTALHPREIEFLATHARLKVLVYSPRTASLVPHTLVEAAMLPLWEIHPAGEGVGTFLDAALGAGSDPFLWEPHEENLLTITFTSGTTGLPKGVVHRAGALLRNAAAFNEMMGFGPDRRFLHVMPMAYMAGILNTLFLPYMAGASVVLAARFDAASVLHFWRPVVQHHADTFWLAPTMCAALVRGDRDRKGAEWCREHVRTICVGTAPLPRRVASDWKNKYGVELLESYGLSELLLVSGNCESFDRREGSVGRLVPGVAVEFGGDGEILVRTPYLMEGYLDYDTGKPNRCLPGSRFATGDLGELDEAGNLYITGRKKDLIIRGGVNISPRSVEEALLDHPAVVECAVLGLPHDFYGEEIAAAVKLRQAGGLQDVRQDLEAWCRQRLAAAAIPTRWVEVLEFPVSTNGKIQKAVLRERLTAGKRA